MGRPVSTDGGRPVSVHVRLSAAEVKRLDAERGGMSRADFLRAPLRPITTHPIDASRAGGVHDVEGYCLVAKVDDTMPVPATHRHRRGEVVGKAFDHGQEIKMYRCSVEGCLQVLQ